MQYLLYGKVSEGKNRVDFTIANMVKKMAMFLKYKSRTMLRHSNDPVALIHAMMKTGHYSLPSSWIRQSGQGGLDLARLRSLWVSQVRPEELEVKDIINIMFPRSSYIDPESQEHAFPSVHEIVSGDVLMDTEPNYTDMYTPKDLGNSRLFSDPQRAEQPRRGRYFNFNLASNGGQVSKSVNLDRFPQHLAFTNHLNQWRHTRTQMELDKSMLALHENTFLAEPSDDDYALHRTLMRNVDTDALLDSINQQMEADRKVVDEFARTGKVIAKDSDSFAAQDDFVSLLG